MLRRNAQNKVRRDGSDLPRSVVDVWRDLAAIRAKVFFLVGFASSAQILPNTRTVPPPTTRAPRSLCTGSAAPRARKSLCLRSLCICTDACHARRWRCRRSLCTARGACRARRAVRCAAPASAPAERSPAFAVCTTASPQPQAAPARSRRSRRARSQSAAARAPWPAPALRAACSC